MVLMNHFICHGLVLLLVRIIDFTKIKLLLVLLKVYTFVIRPTPPRLYLSILCIKH